MPKRKKRAVAKKKKDYTEDGLSDEDDSREASPMSKKSMPASSTSLLDEDKEKVSPFTAISLCNNRAEREVDGESSFTSHFWCNYCEFSADTKKELVGHMRQHMIKCSFCNFSSLSRSEVARHCKNEHDKDLESTVTSASEVHSSSGDCDMDKDPCSACVFCDFMTYSTEHLEKHTINSHPGMLPSSVAKMISKQASTKVRRDDALFYLGASGEESPVVNIKQVANVIDLKEQQVVQKVEKLNSHDDTGLKTEKVTPLIDKKEIVPACSKSEWKVKVETMYCITCPYSSVSVEKLKCHTISQHPLGATMATFNSMGQNSSLQDHTFFCVKESCSHNSTECASFESHLMECCPSPRALNIAERERLKANIAYLLECEKKYGISHAFGFTHFSEKYSSYDESNPLSSSSSSSSSSSNVTSNLSTSRGYCDQGGSTLQNKTEPNFNESKAPSSHIRQSGQVDTGIVQGKDNILTEPIALPSGETQCSGSNVTTHTPSLSTNLVPNITISEQLGPHSSNSQVQTGNYAFNNDVSTPIQRVSENSNENTMWPSVNLTDRNVESQVSCKRVLFQPNHSFPNNGPNSVQEQQHQHQLLSQRSAQAPQLNFSTFHPNVDTNLSNNQPLLSQQDPLQTVIAGEPQSLSADQSMLPSWNSTPNMLHNFQQHVPSQADVGNQNPGHLPGSHVPASQSSIDVNQGVQLQGRLDLPGPQNNTDLSLLNPTIQSMNGASSSLGFHFPDACSSFSQGSQSSSNINMGHATLQSPSSIHTGLQSNSNYHTGLQSNSNYHTGLQSNSNHHTGLESNSNHHTGLQNNSNHNVGLQNNSNHHVGLQNNSNHQAGLQSFSSGVHQFPLGNSNTGDVDGSNSSGPQHQTVDLVSDSYSILLSDEPMSQVLPQSNATPSAQESVTMMPHTFMSGNAQQSHSHPLSLPNQSLVGDEKQPTTHRGPVMNPQYPGQPQQELVSDMVVQTSQRMQSLAMPHHFSAPAIESSSEIPSTVPGENKFSYSNAGNEPQTQVSSSYVAWSQTGENRQLFQIPQNITSSSCTVSKPLANNSPITQPTPNVPNFLVTIASSTNSDVSPTQQAAPTFLNPGLPVGQRPRSIHPPSTPPRNMTTPSSTGGPSAAGFPLSPSIYLNGQAPRHSRTTWTDNDMRPRGIVPLPPMRMQGPAAFPRPGSSPLVRPGRAQASSIPSQYESIRQRMLGSVISRGRTPRGRAPFSRGRMLRHPPPTLNRTIQNNAEDDDVIVTAVTRTRPSQHPQRARMGGPGRGVVPHGRSVVQQYRMRGRGAQRGPAPPQMQMPQQDRSIDISKHFEDLACRASTRGEGEAGGEDELLIVGITPGKGNDPAQAVNASKFSFCCVHCGKDQGSKGVMKRHMKACHNDSLLGAFRNLETGQLLFFCPQMNCAFMTYNEDRLTEHIFKCFDNLDKTKQLPFDLPLALKNLKALKITEMDLNTQAGRSQDNPIDLDGQGLRDNFSNSLTDAFDGMVGNVSGRVMLKPNISRGQGQAPGQVRPRGRPQGYPLQSQPRARMRGPMYRNISQPRMVDPRGKPHQGVNAPINRQTWRPRGAEYGVHSPVNRGRGRPTGRGHVPTDVTRPQGPWVRPPQIVGSHPVNKGIYPGPPRGDRDQPIVIDLDADSPCGPAAHEQPCDSLVNSASDPSHRMPFHPSDQVAKSNSHSHSNSSSPHLRNLLVLNRTIVSESNLAAPHDLHHSNAPRTQESLQTTDSVVNTYIGANVETMSIPETVYSSPISTTTVTASNTEPSHETESNEDQFQDNPYSQDVPQHLSMVSTVEVSTLISKPENQNVVPARNTLTLAPRTETMNLTPRTDTKLAPAAASTVPTTGQAVALVGNVTSAASCFDEEERINAILLEKVFAKVPNMPKHLSRRLVQKFKQYATYRGVKITPDSKVIDEFVSKIYYKGSSGGSEDNKADKSQAESSQSQTYPLSQESVKDSVVTTDTSSSPNPSVISTTCAVSESSSAQQASEAPLGYAPASEQINENTETSKSSTSQEVSQADQQVHSSSDLITTQVILAQRTIAFSGAFADMVKRAASQSSDGDSQVTEQSEQSQSEADECHTNSECPVSSNSDGSQASCSLNTVDSVEPHSLGSGVCSNEDKQVSSSPPANTSQIHDTSVEDHAESVNYFSTSENCAETESSIPSRLNCLESKNVFPSSVSCTEDRGSSSANTKCTESMDLVTFTSLKEGKVATDQQFLDSMNSANIDAINHVPISRSDERVTRVSSSGIDVGQVDVHVSIPSEDVFSRHEALLINKNCFKEDEQVFSNLNPDLESEPTQAAYRLKDLISVDAALEVDVAERPFLGIFEEESEESIQETETTPGGISIHHAETVCPTVTMDIETQKKKGGSILSAFDKSTGKLTMKIMKSGKRKRPEKKEKVEEAEDSENHEESKGTPSENADDVGDRNTESEGVEEQFVRRSERKRKIIKNYENEVPSAIDELMSDDDDEYIMNQDDDDYDNDSDNDWPKRSGHSLRKRGKRLRVSQDESAIDIGTKGKFACWICRKVFSRCTYLKRHILQKHKEGLCAIDLGTGEDASYKPQIILFCPRNCRYATLSKESLLQHESSCEKSMLKDVDEAYLTYNKKFLEEAYPKLMCEEGYADPTKTPETPVILREDVDPPKPDVKTLGELLASSQQGFSTSDDALAPPAVTTVTTANSVHESAIHAGRSVTHGSGQISVSVSPASYEGQGSTAALKPAALKPELPSVSDKKHGLDNWDSVEDNTLHHVYYPQQPKLENTQLPCLSQISCSKDTQYKLDHQTASVNPSNSSGHFSLSDRSEALSPSLSENWGVSLPTNIGSTPTEQDDGDIYCTELNGTICLE